jgi:hypothetical protein
MSENIKGGLMSTFLTDIDKKHWQHSGEAYDVLSKAIGGSHSSAEVPANFLFE